MSKTLRGSRGTHGKTVPLTGRILNAFGQEVGTVLISWHAGDYGPDPGELAVALPYGHRFPLYPGDDRDRMAWSLTINTPEA